MSLVSIGLPVYNGERFLAQALEAHLAQTFTDFEIIVCDNCSSDSTPDIAKSFAARDRRVKYFRSETVLPPAENHNRTFSLASGAYFKWSAHDDLVAPNFLAACVRVLESNSTVVLAYPRAQIIDSNGQKVQDYTYKLNTDTPQVSQRFGALVRANHRKHGAFEIYGLIRSEALRTIPPMGNFPRGDSVVLVRLSLSGKFEEIPEILFFSRDHGTRSVRALPARIKSGRTRLHRLIGTGPLPPLEWWDPTKKGKIDFPEWRVAREYCNAAIATNLPLADRFGCLFQIGLWLTRSWLKLARDIVIATELALAGSPGVERV